MTADTNWWRRLGAVGVLSFAALGVAGCDRDGGGGDQGVEQEAPTGDGAATVDDDATTEGESATEGEHPAEDSDEH